MCMLCVIPEGVVPSREKLENSALNNPHGFGFAIVVPEEARIITHKTMDPDEAVNKFLELREQYKTGYAMWHARLATHGSKTVANCHPFAVGGKGKLTYLAHNGIIDIEIAKADDRSDTRVFAEDLLPVIGGVKALDNELVWDMLEDYLSGSKVCVLTVDPEAQHQCYLLNEQLGKVDTEGVWWSNDSCYLTSYSASKSGATQPYGYYNGYYDYDSWYDEKTGQYRSGKGLATDQPLLIICPDEECGASLTSEDVEMNDGLCYFCGACLDCMSTFTQCNCYRPKSKRDIGEQLSLPTSKVVNGAWNYDL